MSRLSKAKRKIKAQKADSERWYKQYCQDVLAQRPSRKQIRKESLAIAKQRRNQRMSDIAMRLSVRKTVAAMLSV